jgi:hypothetical protein
MEGNPANGFKLGVPRHPSNIKIVSATLETLHVHPGVVAHRFPEHPVFDKAIRGLR